MIEQTITGFTKEQIEGLAKHCGWTETVMTETESPNYEIPNPVSAIAFLDAKFNSPLREAIREYRLKEAMKSAEEKIRQANEELEAAKAADAEYIDGIITIKAELVV